MTKIRNQKSPPPHLTRYKDYVAAVGKNQPLREIFPKLIVLEITNRCNLECIMCKRWQWTKKYPKLAAEIPINKLKSIIDEFKTLGVQRIFISGGEPFLRKDLLDLIEYISQNNIGSNIFTNGTLISQKIAKKLCNPNKIKNLAITFSLDGSKSEVHDKIRGVKNTFNRVIKSIKIIQKFRHHNQPGIKINYTIQKGNVDDLFSFIKFIKNVGVDAVVFNVAHGLVQRISKEFMTKLKNFANYLISERDRNRPPIPEYFELKK